MVFKSIKRGIGGSADFLTRNAFDFDGRGRPGTLKADPQASNKNEGGNNTNDSKNDKKGKGKGKRKFSHPKVLSYPAAISPDERNGTRLLIKCFKYLPPTMDLTYDTGERYADRNGTFEGVKYGKGEVIKNHIENKEGILIKQTGDFSNRTFASNLSLENKGASDRMPGTQHLYYVELPIPQDVNDSNSVTWGDNSLNIFQLAGLSAASAITKDPKKSFSDISRLITDGALMEGLGEGLDANIRDAIAAGIAGKAIDPQGRNIDVSGAIARTTGQVLNNNLELLFDSVNLRSFPFSMTFSPRNAVESMTVKHIIRAFKSSMAAKKGTTEIDQGGIFLKAPDVFHLRYLHNGKDHPFLNSFKHCALTSMAVNYTNAGTFASYSDGTPVSIQMNLTFKELNPIYFEDYDKLEPNDSQGVGF
tara:strand:+ start:10937 stop:12193 length:1257 start_codon:yes stop_codon:yes gene_type:complete